MLNIHELLELAIRHRASDLFLKAGAPPALRIDGTVVSTKIPPLDAPTMEELEWAQEILKAAQIAGTGAIRYQGKMVDLPVIERARQIVEQRSR